VALDSIITAIFSKTMDSSTINNTTFTVSKNGSNISGSINYYGTFATFTPLSSLSPNTGYTAAVTSGVKDGSGNPLPSDANWSFTTGTQATSTVSFASHVQPLFTQFSLCTGCHVSGGSAAFLPLSDVGRDGVFVYGTVYGNLVNQPSTRTDDGTFLVKPGDYVNSVLYQRVSGIGLPYGKYQMPPNGPYLNANEQNVIKTWINEGALLN